MNRPQIDLADLLAAWAAGVTRVAVYPVSAQYLARAFDADDQLIRISPDEHRMLIHLLRGEHPGADWTVAQTWTARDGLRPTRDRLAAAA